MPTGLIKEHGSVSTRRDRLRDFGQLEGHRFSRAARQHQAGSLALVRADGAKDVGRGRPLVFRG
jgi:hypothetical protein